MSPLLEISGLSVGVRKGSGWAEIVRDVSIAVEAGEIVAFIGESGAGKTTLALSALGFTRPGTRFMGGSVHLGGVDVLSLGKNAKRDLRGKTVAYVAQSAAAALNPSITIGRQIVEPLLIHGLADSRQAKARLQELLTLLDLPGAEAIGSRYPLQMSGGQQQRIMTAIAMSCAPKLLVLDEPTTALDVTTQMEVLKAIKDAITMQKASAIYVSHDLAVVAQIASRILVLRNGRIVEEGSAEQIIHAPRHDYTKALLSAVRTLPKDGGAQPRRARTERTPLLSAVEICASYHRGWFGRGVPTRSLVLSGVSLEVGRGETLALVGESGSGKSTLARALAGLHPPVSGTLSLDSIPLAGRTRGRSKEQLRRIQIVFQSPEQALNPRTRVAEAIGRALRFYFGVSDGEKRRRVAELLKLVDLPEAFSRKFPSELSGGERQRVAIARALAAKPDVILCDEFLSALDTIVAAKIVELMGDLRRSHEVTFVFISHDLATVAAISDRVAVMYAGQIVETGRTADLFKAPHHPYTNLLIRSIPELRTDWLAKAIADRATDKGGRGTKLADGPGCRFRNRCPLAIPGTCDVTPPPARDLGSGHILHCHRDIESLAALATPDTRPGGAAQLPVVNAEGC